MTQITKALLKELGWQYDKKKNIWYYPDLPTHAWIDLDVQNKCSLKFIVDLMLTENSKRIKQNVISAISKVIVDK